MMHSENKSYFHCGIIQHTLFYGEFLAPSLTWLTGGDILTLLVIGVVHIHRCLKKKCRPGLNDDTEHLEVNKSYIKLAFNL